MSTEQYNPKKSIHKSFLLVLFFMAIISSWALFASHRHKPTSTTHVCEHALNTKSCLAHVSKVVEVLPTLVTTKDQNLHILLSLLAESIPHIKKAKDKANSLKTRINSSREEIALGDCEHLMDLSRYRILDSATLLRKSSIESCHDAHTWLNTVLTNHATCLDGLEDTSWTLMKSDLDDLISRATTCLDVLHAVLPPKGTHHHFVGETLIGDIPPWVASADRRLLESLVGDVKANVVVASDGSGNFKTVTEAVASAPDHGKTRYVIYVKMGTYKENVFINYNKSNVMLVGDGLDGVNATIITGDLNFVDGATIYGSATVGVDVDGFIAKDIWFQNTAGPDKNQAVALRVSGDFSIIYRCRIDAFQDTLFADTGRQFYRDCFITGTIDFLFGDAAAVFQKCKIVARKPMSNGQYNVITAQGRQDPRRNSGFSIQQCDLTPSADLRPVMDSIKTFLGRPWKKYSKTVVMQSFLDSHIDPTGWAEWNATAKDFLQSLYYGEYMNYGPGANTSKRVNWTGYHVITSAVEANSFTVAQLTDGYAWLNNTGVPFIGGL